MQRIELVKCEVDIKRLEGELRARRGESQISARSLKTCKNSQIRADPLGGGLHEFNYNCMFSLIVQRFGL